MGVCRSERAIRSRAALLALVACLMLAFVGSGLAAPLLGGSHASPLPNLAPLPTPGAGSIPGPGSGSIPDTGTILGPSLSVPLSTGPTVGPLGPVQDPLARAPNLGSELPPGLSPELKNLSRNVRETVHSAGNAGRPVRNGFVLPTLGIETHWAVLGLWLIIAAFETFIFALMVRALGIALPVRRGP